MPKPIRTKKAPSRLEIVLDHIKGRIADGSLKAGVQLPTEVELAQELGVSRTPVREAIKVLAASGVVDVRHGHGTFITDGAQASLAQLLLFQVHLKDTTPQKLMEVRLIFERSCAELAAQRRTPEDLAAMRACIERLRALSQATPRDLDAICEADLDFHRAVYRAAHNELVATIANFVLNMLAGWLRTSHEGGEAANSVRLHEVMLTMIETGNSGGARESYAVSANMEHFKLMLEQVERRSGVQS
ncbi:FadR/GntR family transcriptional regulator [Marinivivus vitaminiproducens]|uniref:FadR/GntR family transcriptional regulator n=1 Tax=Marinivivus vitaminiproducens TaxID=3035935 RepID=UPI0027A0BAD8|nr:FadR/GntR family transcriptional regulator [Geminicoccaceae bacterium SCSIO 64248]